MTRLTRAVVGTLAALAIGVPATAASAASPTDRVAGRHWTTVDRMGGAKHQACKVSVDDGAAWRIYNRVDARRSDARVQATMTVTRRGAATQRTWGSGWTRKGTVSAAGTVRLPRTTGYGLVHSIFGDNAGNGGTVTAASIGRC